MGDSEDPVPQKTVAKKIREIFADSHGRVDETSLLQVAQMYIELAKNCDGGESVSRLKLEEFLRARPEYAERISDLIASV